MKSPIFVANWKLNKSYTESIAWISQNQTDLTLLAQSATIVLCPSFPALAPLMQLSKGTGILVGAQNCAQNEQGNFTGEVSAQSLQEVGCSHAIIGHSERRRLFNETDEVIAKKAFLLLQNKITPILCVGESDPTTELKIIIAALEPQLSIFKSAPYKSHKNIVIAYEPVWAVGSQKRPSIEIIGQVVQWIRAYATTNFPHFVVAILYGGSVNQNFMSLIKNIEGLQGILAGGASLDFQIFKNIVSLK